MCMSIQTVCTLTSAPYLGIQVRSSDQHLELKAGVASSCDFLSNVYAGK